MLPTLIRRTAQNASRADAAHIKRIIELHPAKKVWPPDFKKLSFQEQLRLEKKYKRRLALAMARPRWEKFMKLAQLFTVSSVVAYCTLFADWGQGSTQPFEGLRQSLREFLRSDYVPASPERPITGSKPAEGLPQTK